MTTLTIYIGLPASGKSTDAKAVAAKDGNVTRVNRDQLRLMCDGGKWSPKREKRIVKLEKMIVREALLSGQNVIVDDTNLSPSVQEMWKGIAKECGANFAKKSFLDVPMETCIERDLKRAESVGEDVIRRMYYQHLAPPPMEDNGKPKCVIVDIDGTLAEMGDRSPYDWKRVGVDSVKSMVASVVNSLSGTHEIVITSGRDESCRPETEAWLAEHGVCYDVLLMRAEGDQRKDSIVKAEILDQKILVDFMPVLAIDDRQQVVDMWRSHGIECWQVAPGRF